MPYKHNQLKGIKKYSQNDPKMLYSCSLAVVFRFFLCRQSLRKKTHGKKNIKKPNTTGNKHQVKGKHFLFISVSWSIKSS